MQFEKLDDLALDDSVLISWSDPSTGHAGWFEYWPCDRYLYLYDRDGDVVATLTSEDLQHLTNMVNNRE